MNAHLPSPLRGGVGVGVAKSECFVRRLMMILIQRLTGLISRPVVPPPPLTPPRKGEGIIAEGDGLMADTDIVCISPIDGRELVRRPIMSETAIDAAVKAAREAQKAWRNTLDCRARCEGLRLPRCAARDEPGGGARDRPADGPAGALRRRVPRRRGARALHDARSRRRACSRSRPTTRSRASAA